MALEPGSSSLPEPVEGLPRQAGASADLLREMLDLAPGPIAALDVDFRIIAFNVAYADEFARLFGTRVEVGMRILDALEHLPEQRAEALEIWGRALGGETFSITRTCGTGRQERASVEVTYRPLNDAAGARIGAVQSVRHLGAQLQTERALHNSEVLLSSILHSSLDGIMALKSMRDETGTIVDFEWLLANPRSEHLTGRPPAMLIGRRLLEEMPGKRASGLFDAYVQVVETGVPFTREYFYDEDRIHGWIQSTAVKLDDGLAITFRDITPLKQAEEMRLALAAAQMGTWDVDLETHEVTRSSGTDLLFGYPADGARRTVDDYLRRIHPEDQARVANVVWPKDREPGEHMVECRILRPGEQQPRWIISRGDYLPDVHGRAGRLIGVVTDITERKQAEEALLEADRYHEEVAALLESLLANAPIGFAFFDREHRYLQINEMLAAINGLPVDAHLGRRIAEVVPVNAPVIEPILDQVFATGEAVRDLEVTGETPAAPGVVRHWLTGFYPVQTEGRTIAVGAVVVEISDRRRAEDALRQSEQQLRFIGEASSLLASTLDYDTTLDQISRLLVPRFADYCMLYSIEEDGCYRQVMHAHADPAKLPLLVELGQRYQLDPPPAQSPLARAVASGEVVLVPDAALDPFSTVLSDPDLLRIYHSLGPCSYMLVPLQAHGQVRGVLSLANSLSGRHFGPADVEIAQEVGLRIALALENARLYRAAQTAIHEREALLSVASHELKTPLASLLGYATLLERRVLPGATIGEREQRQARTIAEQATRLSKMLDLLLDVARLDSGQLVLQPEPMDFSLLVARSIAEVEPALSRHSITLHEPEQAAMVLGDELRLEQVVRNLLANAIKYSPEGGEILVRVDSDGTLVRLSIADPGVGIAADALPRLFQRFSRVRSAGTQYIGGLGLGLYIVKEIVARHGGTIEVQSDEGRGSTFTVVLPAHPG